MKCALEAFISVAEKGSFNKAAQANYISSQSLIKQINALERNIGLRLFFRTPRGISLTPAGEEFYKGAHQILSLSKDVLERCREAEQAPEVLRIAQPQYPMHLSRIYNEFSRRYPQIEQQISSWSDGICLERVCSQKADITEGPRNAGLCEKGLIFVPLTRQPRVCLVAPSHPYTTKKKIKLADFAGQYVVVNKVQWMPELITELEKAVPGIKLNEKFCGGDVVFTTCYRGGIYLVPKNYAHNFAPLIAIPLEVDLQWDFGLFHLPHPSIPVQKFVEVARDLHQ